MQMLIDYSKGQDKLILQDKIEKKNLQIRNSSKSSGFIYISKL